MIIRLFRSSVPTGKNKTPIYITKITFNNKNSCFALREFSSCGQLEIGVEEFSERED
jgi:hypothetical protein